MADSKSSGDDNNSNWSVAWGCLTALVGATLGAVIAHPVLFLLAFVWGVIFGADKVMASNPGRWTGLDGGSGAVANLALFYSLSLGIFPLIVSGIGAGLGVGFALLRAGLRQVRREESVRK